MAPAVQDDGFHEIQLNGKQLVFLFMAATVVSVVIFLCGVLVGRGVRADRAASVEVSAMAESPLPLTPAPVSVAPLPANTGADPRSAPTPPPVADETTYFNRLEGKGPTLADDLKPTAPRVEAPVAKAAVPAGTVDAPLERRPAKASERSSPAKAAPARATEAAPTTATAATRPSAGGFTVQVAAVNVRREADQIAKRLEGKGYPAFVVDPAAGAPAMFRVRVGSFKTRAEAETLAARLKQQERFQPWVTR